MYVYFYPSYSRTDHNEIDLSVDLRDAIGDRMYLSTGGLRRDGVFFDVGAATALK